MRDDAIPQMVQSWLSILETYWQSKPELASSSLHVISLYASWIDIGLVVTEKFMRELFQFLSVEELRISAVHCLTEVRSRQRFGVSDNITLLSTPFPLSPFPLLLYLWVYRSSEKECCLPINWRF